jgi:hypothetical protein
MREMRVKKLSKEFFEKDEGPGRLQTITNDKSEYKGGT